MAVNLRWRAAAAMDVGIYPLNGARYLTGEGAGRIKATVDDRSRWAVDEVEEESSWLDDEDFLRDFAPAAPSTYGGDTGGGGFFKVTWVEGMESRLAGVSIRAKGTLTGHLGSGRTWMSRSRIRTVGLRAAADHLAKCVWEIGGGRRRRGKRGLRDIEVML